MHLQGVSSGIWQLRICLGHWRDDQCADDDEKDEVVGCTLDCR